MNRSATVDLIGMGVWVTSFVIQEVADDNDYITSLGERPRSGRERTFRSVQNTKRFGRKPAGKPELAKKIQQARIGKAEMEKDAAKREAEQRRNAETKRYENLITQEEAKKNTDMRLAAIAQQTNQTRAVADMATQRKEMEVMNEKVEREQKVEIARKEQQINVARGEIARKEQELEGSMVRDTTRSDIFSRWAALP